MTPPDIHHAARYLSNHEVFQRMLAIRIKESIDKTLVGLLNKSLLQLANGQDGCHITIKSSPTESRFLLTYAFEDLFFTFLMSDT